MQELNIEPRPIADYILLHPDETPLSLVYSVNGKSQVTSKVQDDLSNLVGFELSYYERDKIIILLKTITKDLLESKGCLKDCTIGKLRKIAGTIHPRAKLINANIAARIWQLHSLYYATKFILGEKGAELPDIQVLRSSEEFDDDTCPWLNWNTSCGKWNYLDDDIESGVIERELPVLLYVK